MSNPPQSEKFEKFAFDNDFFELAVMGTPAAAAQAAAPVQRMPKNIEAAHKQGYEEGFAEGQKQAQAAAAADMAILQQHMAAGTRALETATQQVEESFVTRGLSLLRVSLHRLMGNAAQHYPDQILEHHLRLLVASLRTSEDLTLRIHPQARTYHEKLGLAQANIQGTPFHIIPDSSLGPTDCLIEWSRGGLEAKLAEHLAKLDELLKQTGAENLPTPALPTAEATNPVKQATTEADQRAKQLLGDDDLVDALK